MSTDEEDPMSRFHSRVTALFAANDTLTSITRDGLKKLQQSALSLSKYLSTLYAASFLFLLSSHEQIKLIVESTGAILWATLVVLISLIFESYRAFKLYIGTSTQNYIDEVFQEIKKQLDKLDGQGQQDFNTFLDQLAERFSSAALKTTFPFKFNFLQKLNLKKDEIVDSHEKEKSELMAATDKVISTAEKAKENILESTDKMGKIIGEAFFNTVASMILSALIFFLYLIGLSIPLTSAIFANYQTMFSWVIQAFQYIASMVGI